MARPEILAKPVWNSRKHRAVRNRKAAEEAGLRLLDDMSGHPGLAGYMERGFEIMTF